MFSVVERKLFLIDEGAELAQPNVQIPVLGKQSPRLEPTRFFKGSSPNERLTNGHKIISSQERTMTITCWIVCCHKVLRRFIRLKLVLKGFRNPIDHRNPRVPFQTTHLPFQLICGPKVIIVEEGQVFSCGYTCSGIPGAAQSLVGLFHITYSSICLQWPKNLSGTIR